MRLQPSFIIAVAVLASVGCDRTDPVEPYRPGARPRHGLAGASLGSVVVPTLPTNDPAAYGEMGFQPTGIVIPDSTTVDVKVSGLLHATTNPAWRTAYCENAIVGGHSWACSPADRTNFDLTWKGNSDAELMVKLGVRGSDGQVRTFWLSQRAGQDPSVGYASISVPGQLMVARIGHGLVSGPGRDGYGNTIPAMGALKLQSDQQLTAVITSDRRQSGITLKCTPARLPRGNGTVCTATAQPIGATFVVQNFSFAGDSGATASQPGDSKNWNFVPPQTGTVTVKAAVGGVDRTATARVEVVCNFFGGPTGDPVLDRAKLQQEFQDLWNSSNPGDPGSGRVERGAFILERSGEVELLDWTGPAARCEATSGNVSIPADAQVLGIVHTHPDSRGTRVPTDGSCAGNTEEGRRFGDGASIADRNAARWLNRRLEKTGRPEVNAYVLDREHVHRFGGPSGGGNYPRDNTCVPG